MKYLARLKQCLVNPTDDQVFDREPLLVFSFYLSGRVNVLCSFANEIIENLDNGFSNKCIDGKRIERAESLMWLWILGAYEVVRTMHQAKGCFSERLIRDLGTLKKNLAVVRMPAAKMEKAGEKVAVPSNRSPSGWDVKNHDLLINDPSESLVISARSILAEFDHVFCSISRNDVLSPHERSYDKQP